MMNIKEVYEKELEKYNDMKSKNLDIDISRGKPCKEQLDLSIDLLTCIDENSLNETKTDYRNYGIVDGISEAKKLFADLMGVSTDEMIVAGNSTLTLLYNLLIRSFVFGVPGIAKPWSKEEKIKFLCPCPGYDRHFLILEKLGIEMINIDLSEDGLDMDVVEKLVMEDESIKGIICVPMYSNPTGVCFSDEVVERLASMKTKAEDFRIYWDNAYFVHHLSEKKSEVKNILQVSKKYGTEDRVYMFTSTSKITFPGAGVAMIAASAKNKELLSKEMSVQTIGPDKLNQLRHVKFLKSVENIQLHMQKHAEIIRPKFNLVHQYFEKYLKPYGIADWSYPDGGYFISLNVMNGCATKVIKKAAEAGLKVTPAGSAFPYHKDINDSNIRIAPTYVNLEELEVALQILCSCILVVTLKKKMEQ